MAEIWAAAAVAAVGVGAAVYGANKQSKDNKATQEANAASQAAINKSAWNNWLMSRGIQPNSPVEAGEVPGGGTFKAVNTRLPLWANVNQTVGTDGRVTIAGDPTGAGAAAAAEPKAIGFKDGQVVYEQPAAKAEEVKVDANGNKVSTGQKLANILDPLNVSVGRNKNPLDPLGLFG